LELGSSLTLGSSLGIELGDGMQSPHDTTQTNLALPSKIPSSSTSCEPQKFPSLLGLFSWAISVHVKFLIESCNFSSNAGSSQSVGAGVGTPSNLRSS